MNVLINPGHALYGNPDPGAVNYEVDVTESELAYAIGTKTADYLEKAGCETRVMQSHNLAGEAPEYPEVIGTANAWGADLFVSIHCNAGGGRGAETFCYDRYSSAVPCAKFIQNQLSASFPDDPGFRNRGVKYSPGLCVLRLTEMPAVLVETAFIDNPEDVRLLIEKTDIFAAAIARGVTDYWQMKVRS